LSSSQTIRGEQLVQWLEVDSNLRPSGHKAQNIPIHHNVPETAVIINNNDNNNDNNNNNKISNIY